MSPKSFLSRGKKTLFILSGLFLYSGIIAFANPPSSPYAPGTTLDPACAPGDANCYVAESTSRDITALSNITSNGLLKTSGGTGTLAIATPGVDYSTPNATETLANKTFDTAGPGNNFYINGAAISAVTGTGAVALANSPMLITPDIGAATATSINGNTITTGTGTLTLAAGKTFTASNTLTLAGTDGAILNIGTGGGTWHCGIYSGKCLPNTYYIWNRFHKYIRDNH